VLTTRNWACIKAESKIEYLPQKRDCTLNLIDLVRIKLRGFSTTLTVVLKKSLPTKYQPKFVSQWTEILLNSILYDVKPFKYRAFKKYFSCNRSQLLQNGRICWLILSLSFIKFLFELWTWIASKTSHFIALKVKFGLRLTPKSPIFLTLKS